MVNSCRYLVESAIEDFEVCLIHDHLAVRRILEAFEWPYALWTGGAPAVMSAGSLLAEHFEPVFADDVISARDCPLLARVPEGPNTLCYPDYDLTRFA